MQITSIATGQIGLTLYAEDCACLARICRVARENDTLSMRPSDLAVTRDDLARLGVCVD